jgi:hypothetical protein
MIPSFRNLTKGSVQHGRKNNYVMPVAMLTLLFLVGQVYWLSDNRHRFTPYRVARLPCDTCMKLGQVRDAEDGQRLVMCPTCFGVGHKQVRYFDDLDVICAACGGMGRLREGTNQVWRTCERCDGRGLHRDEAWERMVEVETYVVPPQAPPADASSAPEAEPR